MSFRDFCLLVFDEVHHADKDHVYADLLSMLQTDVQDIQYQPKVLGLTASPAGEIDVWKTLFKVMAILKNSKASLLTPVVHKAELDSVVTCPEMSVLPVPFEKRELELKKQLTVLVNEILKTVQGAPTGLDPLDNNFESLVKMIPNLEENKKEILVQTSNMLDEMLSMGYSSAMQDLEALLEMEGVCQFTSFAKLQEIYSRPIEEDDLEHSKPNYLIKTLIEEFKRDNNFRALVFVKTRRTCL